MRSPNDQVIDAIAVDVTGRRNGPTAVIDCIDAVDHKACARGDSIGDRHGQGLRRRSAVAILGNNPNDVSIVGAIISRALIVRCRLKAQGPIRCDTERSYISTARIQREGYRNTGIRSTR